MSAVDNLKNFLDSDEGKASIESWAKDLKVKHDILNYRIESFHKKFGNKLDVVMEKYVTKYSSSEYCTREQKLGYYESREPMFWFLLEYAEKYCKPCTDQRYFNPFTGAAFYIGQYVLQIMFGQGSAIRIDALLPSIALPTDIVTTYSNNQLRGLVKELKQINKSDTPAKVKISKDMKALYKALKTQYKDWVDKHHAVTDAIRYEILSRIENDQF